MELAKARKLALQKMEEHNLRGADRDVVLEWSFKFDTARKRFGYCSHFQKVISLSAALVRLNSEERVLGTILHEIAHALTPGQGHNQVWKRKLLEIGGDGQRCYSEQNTTVVSAPYIGRCPGGHSHKRFKKPRRGVLTSCKLCCKGFNANYLIKWERK